MKKALPIYEAAGVSEEADHCLEADLWISLLQ